MFDNSNSVIVIGNSNSDMNNNAIGTIELDEFYECCSVVQFFIYYNI